MQPLSRLRGGRDDGIIATHMAITIAFALFAVTQLTRTTVAAQEIDTRVSDIVTSVATVDEETKTVAILDDTGQITTDILSAAKPLEGMAKQITDEAQKIDGNVKDILASANSINENALGIGVSVGGIGSDVQAINGTANDINANARSILGTFQALTPVVNSINGINARGSDPRLGGPGAIQGGVSGIDMRADVVIELSRGIKGDTGNILANAVLVDENALDICRSRAVGGCAGD